MLIIVTLFIALCINLCHILLRSCSFVLLLLCSSARASGAASLRCTAHARGRVCKVRKGSTPAVDNKQGNAYGKMTGPAGVGGHKCCAYNVGNSARVLGGSSSKLQAHTLRVALKKYGGVHRVPVGATVSYKPDAKRETPSTIKFGCRMRHGVHLGCHLHSGGGAGDYLVFDEDTYATAARHYEVSLHMLGETSAPRLRSSRRGIRLSDVRSDNRRLDDSKDDVLRRPAEDVDFSTDGAPDMGSGSSGSSDWPAQSDVERRVGGPKASGSERATSGMPT